MWMSLAMTVAFIISMVLPVAVVIGIVTYVKRTRYLQRAESDGSVHGAVLDGLDQVQIRLDAMSERLARLEEHMRIDEDRADRLPRPEGGEDGATGGSPAE